MAARSPCGCHRPGGSVGRASARRRARGARRRRSDALSELPGEGLAGAQRDQLVGAELERERHAPLLALERDRVAVERQPVELRAEYAGEAFELVERPGLLERAGVKLDRRVRGVDTGAAAIVLLCRARVRRAVRAEEELRIARYRGFDQRLAVCLALEQRQAIVVWADPAHEQRYSAQQQAIR